MNKLVIFTAIVSTIIGLSQSSPFQEQTALAPINDDADQFGDEDFPDAADEAVGYDLAEFIESDDGDGFSELSIEPSDADEISGLAKTHHIFQDFCLKSRSSIWRDIKRGTNQLTSDLFKLMFSSASEVVEDVVKVQREAVVEGTKLIQNGVVKPQTKLAASKQEATTALDRSVENITLTKSVPQAVRDVIKAVLNTASTKIFEKIVELRTKFTADTLTDMIENVCHKIQFDLIKVIEDDFKKAKEAIRLEIARTKKSDVQEQLLLLNRTRSEKISCTTTTRVRNLSKFCDIFKLLAPSLSSLLGEEESL